MTRPEPELATVVPVLDATVPHPSRSSATLPPDRAATTVTSQDDTEMSNPVGHSSDSTEPKQPRGACGIGACHKTKPAGSSPPAKTSKPARSSPPAKPGPAPISWGTWRTPRTYNAQGSIRPLIMEEEEGWHTIPPNFNPAEHRVYEPIQKTFRRAKKEQESFRNTVSHASYLSEAARTNRLPLWAYRVGPIPGYFDKEDPRWAPLFELIHNQAIERVRCIQEIMEARAKELSQLYLGDRENLVYLVRAHPSMLQPLECKLMAYANTSHKVKLTDHWQSLATAPSPTAVNAEIKRCIISSAGSDNSNSGGRPNNPQPPTG